MWALISITGLLCLTRCSALPTEEEARAHVLKHKKVYSNDNETNYEIVLDDQAIRDNTLVHAGCKVDKFREEINCLFVLQMFPEAKRVDERTCRIFFRADKARQITNQFRLKKLFGRHLAFVWADEEKLQSDAPKKHLVLSFINMHNCKIIDHKFETSIDDFHVIPYDKTFDVYYRDERQCERDFMCGESFDSTTGKLLNGPATSYLPSEYFSGNTLMCSVQANSSGKGHYLMAPPNFHLIGADFGKKENMGPLPLDDQVTAYACDEEFLGYCWRTTNPEDKRSIINCQQFNSRGKLILSTGTSPEYRVGAWMAIRNLNASQLLLLVNKCDNLDSCLRSTKDVEFRVLRMNPDGGTKELHAFRGLECDNARDIRSEVTRRKEDARVCATLACLVRNEDSGSQSVNLLSTCVQD